MVYIPYMTVLYMVYNPQQTCEAGAPGVLGLVEGLVHVAIS